MMSFWWQSGIFSFTYVKMHILFEWNIPRHVPLWVEFILQNTQVFGKGIEKLLRASKKPSKYNLKNTTWVEFPILRKYLVFMRRDIPPYFYGDLSTFFSYIALIYPYKKYIKYFKTLFLTTITLFLRKTLII